MRLICPNCDAQYEIDAAMLPPEGRDVQCSACGHVWFQDPEPAAGLTLTAPPPAPEALQTAEDEATFFPDVTPDPEEADAPIDWRAAAGQPLGAGRPQAPSPAAAVAPADETKDETDANWLDEPEQDPFDATEPPPSGGATPTDLPDPAPSDHQPVRSSLDWDDITEDLEDDFHYGDDTAGSDRSSRDAALFDASDATSESLMSNTARARAAIPPSERNAGNAAAVAAAAASARAAVTALLQDMPPHEGLAQGTRPSATERLLQGPAPSRPQVDDFDEDDDELPPLTADEIAFMPRPKIDEEKLNLLREEAERETRARAAEVARQSSRGLEMQPDLGLPEVEPPVRLHIGPRSNPAIADEPEEEPVSEAAKAPRRALLPDIERINQTLEASDGSAHAKDAADPAAQSSRRMGFRSGFLLAVVVAVAALLLYRNAAELGQKAPQFAQAIDGYVAWVDGMRLGLDGLLRRLLSNDAS